MSAGSLGATGDASRHPFATDLAAFYALAGVGVPGPLRRLRLWLLDSDLHVVVCFRFGQVARRLYSQSRVLGLVPLLAAALWRRWQAAVRHVAIDRQARIGAGLYVTHRRGIFIGPVSIGRNCVLHHDVTIGERGPAGGPGAPRIGDDVWIGPGATISGDITIGNWVTISADSVVSASIPDGALVAGNPGRVVQADHGDRPTTLHAVHAGGPR